MRCQLPETGFMGLPDAKPGGGYAQDAAPYLNTASDCNAVTPPTMTLPVVIVDWAVGGIVRSPEMYTTP